MTPSPGRAPTLASAFRFALAGLWHALATQRNARIHALATVLALLLAAWLRVSRAEWLALLAVIGLVWTAELVNTALEAAVDLAAPGPDPRARVAKDAAAAGVLVAAVVAAVVGLLVFAPRLWTILRS